MVTIGNIIAPISESCGSCNRFENNATAHINPKTDDSAKNPLSLLNGRLAFITPARLINPTERYIKSEPCALSIPKYLDSTRMMAQHTNTAIPFGRAELIAACKKLFSHFLSFFSNDMKNAGNASITASISVIWIGINGKSALKSKQSTPKSGTPQKDLDSMSDEEYYNTFYKKE